MGRPFNVEAQELLQVLSFCSHVLEDFTAVKAGLLTSGLLEEMHQLDALGRDVAGILAKIDAEHPALMSMPKDGVPWSERSI